MATLAELQKQADELIRKGLEGSVFVAPYSENTEITELMDADGGLIALPEGYEDVGLITKDQGVSWSREVETADVESLGRAEPTRRDVTSDVTGLEFTMQEMKALTLELYEGVSLADAVAEAAGTHSNVTFDKPDRPASIYYRALALFKDGEGADAFYFAKWLPRVQVTDRSEQSWNEGDEVQFGVTVTAFNDSDFGTAVRTLLGVPASMVEKMGFSNGSGGGGVEG